MTRERVRLAYWTISSLRSPSDLRGNLEEKRDSVSFLYSHFSRLLTALEGCSGHCRLSGEVCPREWTEGQCQTCLSVWRDFPLQDDVLVVRIFYSLRKINKENGNFVRVVNLALYRTSTSTSN